MWIVNFVYLWIYPAFEPSSFVPDTYSVIISFIIMKHRGLIPQNEGCWIHCWQPDSYESTSWHYLHTTVSMQICWYFSATMQHSRMYTMHRTDKNGLWDTHFDWYRKLHKHRSIFVIFANKAELDLKESSYHKTIHWRADRFKE